MIFTIGDYSVKVDENIKKGITYKIAGGYGFATGKDAMNFIKKNNLKNYSIYALDGEVGDINISNACSVIDKDLKFLYKITK